MRVLHLPTSVGGMSWGLSCGERALGLDSKVLVSHQNQYNYACDYNLELDKINNKYLRKLKEFQTFFEIRNKYDAYHFNYGSSLINIEQWGLVNLDLPFYPKKAKKVVTYNGSDARLNYFSIEGNPLKIEESHPYYNSLKFTADNRDLNHKKIASFSRQADAIFAVNPDLLYFLPERAKFLPYAISNWEDINAAKFRMPRRIITIVHAPTNRALKGTDSILTVIDKVKAHYRDAVRLVLAEKMTHMQALFAYQHADLVIDQIFIGWYGGLAVEVMKMGKPVMAFVREKDLQFLPPHMAVDCQKAIINVNENTLFTKICEIIDNPEILREKREAGLEYVHKWHNPLYVASLVKSAYES